MHSGVSRDIACAPINHGDNGGEMNIAHQKVPVM
jgi:hypothetical protein